MFESSLDALYPLVQALGWALIHFCWQGALIAAVYAAGSLTLRYTSPTRRYLFGLVNMVLMAAAPILTVWQGLDSEAAKSCIPVTGSRICRSTSSTSLLSQDG